LYLSFLVWMALAAAGLKRIGSRLDHPNDQETRLSVGRGTGLGLLLVWGGALRLALLLGIVSSFTDHDTGTHAPDLLEGGPGFGWMIPLVVLIGPITEELTFRGLLLPGLHRWLRPELAYLLSAVAFAVLHAPLYGVATVIVLWIGIALAWARHRTQGLLAPIAIHVCINSAWVLKVVLS
jgi:membrane protease YdiL (CAAX protease family)